MTPDSFERFLTCLLVVAGFYIFVFALSASCRRPKDPTGS